MFIHQKYGGLINGFIWENHANSGIYRLAMTNIAMERSTIL